MATSPHQPESLADEITRLKAELASYRSARDQVLAIGQSTSGGGTSTNYPELTRLDATIARLEARIRAKVDQLNGETANLQPGVNLLSHASEYS
jgi:hypothetical protein